MLANASAWIDKIRKELNSLADRVAKGEVRDTFRADLDTKDLQPI